MNIFRFLIRYLLLFVVMFFCGYASTQPITFEKAYPFWGGNMGADLIQTADNGYYIAGNQALNINWTNLLNIGVDSMGNMVWYNIVGTGPSGGGGGEWSQNKMVALSDSVIYTIGRSNVVTGIPNQRNIVLYRLDGAGDTLWTRNYDFTNHHAVYDISMSIDNNFLVSGEAYNQGAYIMKLDLNGDTIWTKIWTDAYGGASAYRVISTFDGGVAATGVVKGPLNYHYMFLLKLSSDGAVEWFHTYPPQSLENSSAGNDLVQLPDSGYIIAGRGSTYKPEVFFNIHDRFIVRTNVLGDTLWTYKSGGNRMDNINNIILQEAKLITSGRNYNNTGDHSIIRGDVEIKAFNLSGEIIWERIYSGEKTRETYGMIKTSDGGFALTGRVHTESSLNCVGNCVYLLKLDSLGCLVPNCHLPDTTVNVYTQELSTISLSVFPNPTFGEITVEYTSEDFHKVSIELHDLLGRKYIIDADFDLQIGRHAFQVSLSNLPSGIYILRITDREGAFSIVHRLVVL